MPNLGIFLDADLTMRTHVQWTAAGGFAALRKLRSIRRSIPTSVYQALTVLLVVSRLDYSRQNSGQSESSSTVGA